MVYNFSRWFTIPRTYLSNEREREDSWVKIKFNGPFNGFRKQNVVQLNKIKMEKIFDYVFVSKSIIEEREREI